MEMAQILTGSELQCENKLIHMIKHSKCWKMTGLGQATRELLSFKVE